MHRQPHHVFADALLGEGQTFPLAAQQQDARGKIGSGLQIIVLGMRRAAIHVITIVYSPSPGNLQRMPGPPDTRTASPCWRAPPPGYRYPRCFPARSARWRPPHRPCAGSPPGFRGLAERPAPRPRRNFRGPARPGGAPAGVPLPGCPAGFLSLPGCRRPPAKSHSTPPLFLTVRLPALRQTRSSIARGHSRSLQWQLRLQPPRRHAGCLLLKKGGLPAWLYAAAGPAPV